MKIGLRGGHSPYAVGAVGLRKEYECMQELYKYTEVVLSKYGHTVINCNSDGRTVNDELYEGTNKANNNNVDLFVSLHMNSCNGNAYGTEAWTYGPNSKANSIAKRLVNNFSILGFHNRGVKYNPKYYEMKNIKAPNIIFETLFCDSSKDVAIWSATPYEKMARLIANAIDPNIPLEEEIINFDHYATEQVNVEDGKGNITGALWKDEQCELRWVTEDCRLYIRYWNSSKTKIKEGLVEKGKESKILKIGEEPPKEEVHEPDVIYKVQVGAYKNKANAEKLLKELSEKGVEGFIKKE